MMTEIYTIEGGQKDVLRKANKKKKKAFVISGCLPKKFHLAKTLTALYKAQYVNSIALLYKSTVVGIFFSLSFSLFFHIAPYLSFSFLTLFTLLLSLFLSLFPAPLK